MRTTRMDDFFWDERCTWRWRIALLYFSNITRSFSSGISPLFPEQSLPKHPLWWLELKASTACNIAGSVELAWKTKVVQNGETNMPGSFRAVRHSNHSRHARSSVLIVQIRREKSHGRLLLPVLWRVDRWPYPFPPPPQTPYPSQALPVEIQRLQAGFPSSHLTFRVLPKMLMNNYSWDKNAYLQVRQPDFTLVLPFWTLCWSRQFLIVQVLIRQLIFDKRA